ASSVAVLILHRAPHRLSEAARALFHGIPFLHGVPTSEPDPSPKRVVVDQTKQIFPPVSRAGPKGTILPLSGCLRTGTASRAHSRNPQSHVLELLHRALAPRPRVVRHRLDPNVIPADFLDLCCRRPRLPYDRNTRKLGAPVRLHSNLYITAA